MMILNAPLKISLILLLWLLIEACRKPPAFEDPPSPKDCVDEYDPAVDYFPDKALPRYAKRFTVDYHPHFKLVTVTLPDAEASLSYLLLQCGTPRPDGYGDAEVIEIPVETVVTTSTTELPHLVSLGLVDRLVGHDDGRYVSSPEVRRRIESGAVVDVGQETRLNFEILLDVAPDLVLAASLGSLHNEIFAKLRQADVGVAHVPSFLETTPLGRAEWILFTALFFNREGHAADLFDDVAGRYLELAERGRAAGDPPRVLLGGPIGDVWHMPGGESFMAHLVADAGGDYLWADEPRAGSLPLSLESVYERAVNADYWIHPSSWTSLAEIARADERFTTLTAFAERRVYSNDARMNSFGVQAVGGNDYWETGTARPDVVLADLLSIFHPDLVPEHELYFHRRLDD